MLGENQVCYVIGDDDWPQEEWDLVHQETRILVDGRQIDMRSVIVDNTNHISSRHTFEFFYSNIIVLHDMLGNDGHEFEAPEGAEVLLINRENVLSFVQESFNEAEAKQDMMSTFLEFARIGQPQRSSAFRLFHKAPRRKIEWVWTDVTDISSVNERVLKVTGECVKYEDQT